MRADCSRAIRKARDVCLLVLCIDERMELATISISMMFYQNFVEPCTHSHALPAPTDLPLAHGKCPRAFPPFILIIWVCGKHTDIKLQL